MTDDEQIQAALTKRLNDWFASASETYAGAAGSPNWRKGLVGYLLNGPDAVSPVVKRLQAEALETAVEKRAKYDPCNKQGCAYCNTWPDYYFLRVAAEIRSRGGE